MVLGRLHAAPATLPRSLSTLIAETHAFLDDVAAQERALAPWTGTLRRLMAARTVGASTAIEGYSASQQDTVRLMEGQASEAAPPETEDAIRDYRRAMDRVAGLAVDPEFDWRPGVIRDLHFLVTASARGNYAGRWRDEEVHVRRGADAIPYQAPPAFEVAGLMKAAAEFQAASDADPLVRAAMLHLHVAAVHPFVDGNGRTARVLQSLVLARARLLPLDVCSIESFLAANTDLYYAALRTTNGVHRLGGPEFYDPARSAVPWLEFCLHAHAQSTKALLGELHTAQRRAAFCLALARRRELPDRVAHVLDQALVELPLSNESHRQRQNVSMPTATKDLGALVQHDWLRRTGGGRSTRYEASSRLRAMWRRAETRATRVPRP
jgi:Fic family protein